MNLKSLKEKRKFSKEESLEFIKYTKDNFLISEDVSAYLTGFKLVSKNPIEIQKDGLGRNPKENFLPQLQVLDLFLNIVERLSVYLPNEIEPKNKKDEARLMKISDPMYCIQNLPRQLWSEVRVDYYMAGNDVIYKELAKDFAKFIVSLEEVRKIILKKSKEDKRIFDFYEDIFKDFNPKTNWFSFVLEDMLTLGAGFNSKHNGIPCDLSGLKRLFFDTYKSHKKEIKETISVNLKANNYN